MMDIGLMIIQFSYQEEERPVFLQLFLLVGQHDFLECALVVDLSDHTVKVVGFANLISVRSSHWQSFELH